MAYNLKVASAYLRPYLSDDNCARELISVSYLLPDSELEKMFVEYNASFYTRTGLIEEYLNIESKTVAAVRHLHKDSFLNKLGCLREVTGGLRYSMLQHCPRHTTIWGMTPRSVVALSLNQNRMFNYTVSNLLEIALPPYFSMTAVLGMLE